MNVLDILQRIQWRPQIGDPTLMGWVTVVAYGCTATTSCIAAIRTAGSDRRMWWLVGTLLALLCLNKQLDLQSLFTDIGRIIAFDQGWYEERRIVQKEFVLGLLALSGMTVAYLIWRFHDFWKKQFLLAAGLAFLLTFILIRAVSFHHFDSMLKITVGGVKMNWFLELTGIGLVWLAALLACFKDRTREIAKSR